MKTHAIWMACALGLGLASAAHAQTGFSDRDKSYLKDEAEGNLAEVKMAQLALKTTKNADIRAFASRMVTDHTSLYNAEKPLAMSAGVSLPTTPSALQTASYLKLKVLTGDTFDKSYVKGMVEDHREDIQKANAEDAETQNPSMKKLAMHSTDVMSQHKTMIDGIAGKLGIQ